MSIFTFMVDLYVQDRSLLNGQPKRTIADYVEAQGVLVPRRFDTLREARQSGVKVLCRSEHPQEYDGVSGMLKSKTLDKLPDTDEEGLRNELLKEDKRKVFFPKVFCSYVGLDLDSFLREVSFSYWEKLGGRNRTVVADSSIKWKYHIMSYGKEDGGVSYAVLQDGKIIAPSFMENPADCLKELHELVSVYEKIRNLDNFDPNHCSIMEFQTVEGKHFFLQYHRARDFKEREFKLEREKEDDEIETLFVRGATSPDGLICKSTLAYAGWELGINYEEWVVPDSEEGSFDMHYNLMFSEIMTKKRKLQVLRSTSLESEMASLAIRHIDNCIT